MFAPGRGFVDSGMESALSTDHAGKATIGVQRAIGDATNNIAEYSGLREALRRAVRTTDRKIIFEVDSDVVARQVAEMSAWVCRAESLRDLHDDCRALGEELSDRGAEWSVRHVYREYN